MAHLLPSEVSNSSPAGSQAGALLPSREGSSSSQAVAHLLSGEGSNSPPAIAHLPPGEGSNLSPVGSQLGALLPSMEGRQFFPQQLLTFPWVKEAVLPRPLLTILPGKEAVPPRPLLTFPQGKVTVLPRQVNLTIKLGQSGKALGILPGIGHPRLPRRIALSPGKTTPPLPPSRLPQGSSNEEPNPKWVINLSNKPLTPVQRSVLAKGPNFVVTPRQPPNLKYITAIEAVCTKLSQQDAEELRADINRVLRSSHPPNLT